MKMSVCENTTSIIAKEVFISGLQEWEGGSPI